MACVDMFLTDFFLGCVSVIYSVVLSFLCKTIIFIESLMNFDEVQMASFFYMN